MKLRWNITFTFLVACVTIGARAIPTSLVEEIKANELGESKVKRSHGDVSAGEERVRDNGAIYGQPTAIKRGTTLKNDNLDRQALTDWDQERTFYQDALPNLQSTLYSAPDGDFDDKTIAEYEKGFRYGTNKDKLDQALENAVLKSELYGDPSAVNQYRYYGGGAEEKRRRRRDARKMRLDNRIKRDIELSPEDILTILTLYENDRQHPPTGYRTSWQRFEPTLDLDGDRDENDIDQDEESWLDTPVYPHASSQFNPGYFYEDKKKRFMVARKRNDPTRELRYLNGPNKNDFYTLSQLLNSQREPNMPVYHRLVL